MELVIDDIKIKNTADELKTKIIRKEVQLASKEFDNYSGHCFCRFRQYDLYEEQLYVQV